MRVPRVVQGLDGPIGGDVRLNRRTLLKTSPTLRRGSGPPTFTGTIDDEYLDETNHILYYVIGGSWYYVQLTLYTPAAGTPAGWQFDDALNSGHAMLTFD